LELIGQFGDGVWGQEQERVEIAGFGFGVALRDRVEFTISSYVPTRTVQNQTGETTTGVGGKVRLGDFYGGRASVGINVVYMSAQRDRGTVQDERMAALDIALPVAFYPFGEQFVDHRWSVYVAPRLVFQTFEDRLVSETTKGTLAAALLGVAARWRYVALTGELNFARTPSLSFGGTTSQSGWLLLPIASVTGMLPIGD
jgi:hypothetical protein